MSIQHDDHDALPTSFNDLMELLRVAGKATLSADSYVKVMHMDILTFAKNAKVHPSTVRHAPDSESVQRYMRDSLKVIKAAADLSGDLGKAIYWYKNDPLQTFRYKTAQMVVDEGRGESVLRYLNSWEAGAQG